MKGPIPLILLAAAALAVGLGLARMQPSPGRDILLGGATLQAAHGTPGVLALSVSISNRGAPDRLLGLTSPQAASAGLVGVAPGVPLAIPGGGSAALAVDGVHGRLDGLAGPLAPGRLVPVALIFERSGTLATRARLKAGKAPHGTDADHAPGPKDPQPRLSLSVVPDGTGWRLHAEAADFAFAEDLADGPHVPGTGHGHLYLDGLKLQRLYRPEARIGPLPTGSYTLRVVLNTNDHRTYVVDGIPVAAEVGIAVP